MKGKINKTFNKTGIKINQQLVDESQIDKNNSMILNYSDDRESMNLPNAEELLDEIIKLLECSTTAEMILIKKENQKTYEDVMEEKFQDFANNYYSVFKMVLSGENLDPLFKMLKAIDNVNKGEQSLEKAEKNVGKYLGKFLPDSLKSNLAENLKD